MQPRITLSRYVEWRTGVPLGARGSLVGMLRRSLGAGTFAGFWRHWNPIWGYYLSRHVNTPLRRLVPAAPALVVTFLVSGAIHDLAVSLVTGSATFLFVPWFGALGIGVVVTSSVGLDFGSHPWLVRAGVNVGFVLIGLGLALGARRVLGLP